MKIIIGNHIEHSILKLSNDDRKFSQRVLWFAEEGDMIILSAKPDEAFLDYVCSMTGVNPSSLIFHVPPHGGSKGKHFNPYGLTDEEFLASLSKDLKDRDVSEILPLWPSPAIARFAILLGLSDRLSGTNFFLQNGVELVNNKANFRAFFTTAGLPIAPGEVCQGIMDAELAIGRLLPNTGAVMVKQVHSGAAAGNELVVLNSNIEVDHVGARNVHKLDNCTGAIREYLEERWDWASVGGKRPVVIEEFKPKSQTIYAEFLADELGVHYTGSGRLHYTGGRLTQETAPLRGVTNEVRSKLLMYAERASIFYHAIGYRGYLSADAIVDEEGELIFTEMNARISSSLHLYDSIARRIVDVDRDPERTVFHCQSPNNWAPLGLTEFLSAVEEIGCIYDPELRKGVIVHLPILLDVGRSVAFCIVYETESEKQEIYMKLDTRFRER